MIAWVNGKALAVSVPYAQTTAMRATPFLMFPCALDGPLDHYSDVIPGFAASNLRKAPEDHPVFAGQVLSASFSLFGQLFHAYAGGDHFSFSSATSIQVTCQSQDEIDRLYDGLTEGGVAQPCGWLQDRFGLSWQIIPSQLVQWLESPDALKAARVLDAMLLMHKMDLARLEAAYAG